MFGQVVSANVVGYQNINVPQQGYTWTLATVEQIGVTDENQTMDMFQFPSDIMLGASNGILLEFYDENSTPIGRYYYLDEVTATEAEGLSKGGWYDADFYDENYYFIDECYAGDAKIPFGKGVIITSGEFQDLTLTFAGQVVTGSKTFDVPMQGYTWTGNCTPIDLKMKDMAIPAEFVLGSSSGILFEFYDEASNPIGRYYYLDEFTAIEVEGVSYAGWYDANFYDENYYFIDDVFANEETMPSAKMCIITSSELADTTITVPMALPAAE